MILNTGVNPFRLVTSLVSFPGSQERETWERGWIQASLERVLRDEETAEIHANLEQ